MGSQSDEKVNSQQNNALHTEQTHIKNAPNTFSTVSSFTTESGEFVLWFILGSEVRDEETLQQMAAKEIMEWDPNYAEFLYGMGNCDTLPDIHKRIEQTNQAARRSGKALFVIVNYELIESESVKEMLDGLIRACGRSVTFVLISGHDISVGMRAQSKLRRPGGPHFELTREDIRVYYTAIGIILSDRILDRVYQISQGETILVSRLGECLKRLQPLEDADVDSAVENLSWIFMSEYYTPYSEAQRQLLVLLSLLEDFTLELLCELTTFDIDEIHGLLQMHVFIHHNLENDIYYIQKHYRNFLRNQLPELPKKLRFGFLRKAALWHEGKGELLRTLMYYAQCSDYDKMVGSIRKISALYLDRASSEALLSILAQIPQAVLESCADFELVRCLSLLNLGRDAQALQELFALRQKLEKKIRTSDEDAVLGNIHLTLALREWNLGSAEYLPHIIKACKHLKGKSTIYGLHSAPIVGNVLRFKEMHSGDLMAMKDAALQAIPYIKVVIPAKCSASYLAAAEAHLCHLEFEEARLYAGEAIKESKASRQWGMLCEAYYLLQRISMAVGDLDEISSFKNQIHDYCQAQNMHGNGFIDRLSQAHFNLYMGFYDRVKPWIEHEHIKPSAYMRRTEIGRDLYFHALYLFLVKRQYYPAIFFIDESMPVCYENGLWNYCQKLTILKSIVYSTMGMPIVAMRFFKEAYQTCKENEIVFLLAEFGEMMVELLDDIKPIASDIDPLWIKNIHEKASKYEKNKTMVRETYLRRHSESTEKKLYKLTGREFLALKHLCNGLTNEEIAQQMKVEGTSVYHYLSMAYKKIGAKGHNDAVRISVLEGILDMGLE